MLFEWNSRNNTLYREEKKTLELIIQVMRAKARFTSSVTQSSPSQITTMTNQSTTWNPPFSHAIFPFFVNHPTSATTKTTPKSLQDSLSATIVPLRLFSLTNQPLTTTHLSSVSIQLSSNHVNPSNRLRPFQANW